MTYLCIQYAFDGVLHKGEVSNVNCFYMWFTNEHLGVRMLGRKLSTNNNQR